MSNRNDIAKMMDIVLDQIGGIDRYALWADSNYTEFAKLYPKYAVPENQGDHEIVVHQVLQKPDLSYGKDSRASLHPQEDLPELSQSLPEMGHSSSSPPGRENGSDDK